MAAANAEQSKGAAREEAFVAAMRRATRRQHHISDALILSKLVVVLTNRRLYGQALGQFLPVYAALEDALAARRDDPLLQEVADLLLALPRRAAAMEADLQFLLGPGWRAAVPKSATAESYAQHLRGLAAGGDPALLLPYAWSLHVPVMLPFMGRKVAQGLRLREGGGGGGDAGCGGSAESSSTPGLAFFEVPGKAARLAELRAAVNRAGEGLTPGQRAACLDEAVQTFKRNNAVAAEFRLPLSCAAAAAGRLAWAARAWIAALLVALLALAAALRARRGGGAWL